MFIFTAKLSRRRIVAAAAAAVLLCGAAAAAAAALSPGPEAVSTAAASPQGVDSNEARVAYLSSYGWTVAEEPVSVEELILPETFDETYAQYLQLQSAQGFDLTAYAGRRVKRYTYEITNYPTGETGVLAGLLIYRDTVVGGDVLSSDLNGFIHGLARPE